MNRSRASRSLASSPSGAFAALAVAIAMSLAGCVNVPDTDDTPLAPQVSGYSVLCEGIAKGGAAWTEPCLAFASPNDSPSKTEIDLAVNPTDPSNVVVSSKDLDPLASECVWAIPQVSKDGGATWTTVYIGGEKASRAPTDPLYGWNCITDPIMAFDAEGTLYYSLQAYDHTVEGSDIPQLPIPIGGLASVGSAIIATRSTDGGLTWDPMVTLHAGEGTAVFHDYMRVLVNPATGTYHTIWNQISVFTVVPVLVSWDGTSQTARAPVYIPVPDAPAQATMAGFAAAGDGTLYVLLDSGSDGYISVSRDDGRTWSAPAKVDAFTRTPIARQALGDDAFRTTGAYELAVDTSGGERDGRVYAIISGCEAETECDIFVSSSDDAGATWTEAVLVNDGDHKPGIQWIPRPWVDPRGGLHLLYFDNSRGQTGTWIDASWAVSTDGGATWSNAYLTSAPFDGNLGIHQDGPAFIGDYNGIGGAGDHVYMGFPTTVTGRAEIAVAKVRLPEE